MTDDLTGTLVLVHPSLHNDPAGMQGEIGRISRADILNDDIFVGFGGKQGLYSSDALLVLLPDEDIHRHLADMAYETSFPVLKALTQVDLFLRYGGENGAMKGMAIAQANPAIRNYCLETLEDRLRLDRGRGYPSY
jgi:hypothetical protein